MNIDKLKKELTQPIFDHINSLTLEQLQKQKKELEQDMELISTPNYFNGNSNDLYRIRNIELEYINYLIN
jgi:hypothetical protein